ncbi:LTA synthase family protein [Enterococcus camelliae]|uniref:LTA synthase family protein n=1 Tax=Enterococcus camelliae TaxID=453959 RepID=A0ABW5TG25_9ENTE
MFKQKISSFINTRLGFFSLLAVLLWLKNILAFTVDLKVGLENPLQYFIVAINPIASTLLLLSVALYIRRKAPSYVVMMIVYAAMTILLYANVNYYREFTDFITINTMLGAGKVSSGLGESALRLFRWYDVFYFVDILVLILALAFKKIKMQVAPVRARMAFAVSALSIMIFSGNLFLAETDRPELLTRTFSNDYLVKYLGINTFTGYDAVQTYKTNQVRAKASATDLDAVKEYVRQHYAAPNDSLFGIAKGRNVIYIHLESTQQFIINYKLKDANGVEHEVTPFLNSLYNSNSTYSFDNFFHQVKAGKTSDAETLMENSLFGLDQGSLFTQLGGKNTFQSAPNILQQTQGYTSAVFHGNVGNFWNRNETYKHFGYDYFFDSSYYDVNDENSFQYGLMDKPFLNQSIKYLERLQQPFYSKFILVSNHFPYSELSGNEAGFPQATTDDETINNYFATENYMDTAIKEFFDYLKASGLYDNSIIVLYGDHYGISNSRNKELATLLGKTKDTWTDYDNAQMQRVPYMIHIPGTTSGGVNHTYGGEVDALPTLLHLLGVDTSKYIQLGQDLLSKDHNQVVAFRDGSFVTPNYTYYGDTLYENATGQAVTEPSEKLKAQVKAWKKEVREQLDTSDTINNGDLLRFYTDSGLTTIDSTKYSYLKQMDRLEAIENKLGENSTSVYSKNGNKSTVDLFKTETYKQLNPDTTSTTESTSGK